MAKCNKKHVILFYKYVTKRHWLLQYKKEGSGQTK